MSLFNGLRPTLASTSARRKVNEGIKEKFCEVFKKDAAIEEELLQSGFSWEDDLFECSRGLSLGYMTLVPSEKIIDEKNAGIIFCHGYSDHLRWLNLAKFIKYGQNGFLVTGLELEGHGISDSKHGLFTDINATVTDLYEFIKQQQAKYPLKKWFLHGESMGGMVALLMSNKAKEMGDVTIDGMVLASPMCKIADTVKPPPYLVSTLLFLAKFFPSLSIVPSSLNDTLVFRDPDYREKTRLDPLNYLGKPRMATAATMYQATMEMEQNLNTITTPFFVLHGKKDVVTTVTASIDLYEKSNVDEADKEILLPEDGWHALLNAEPEEDMAKYWESILQWLNKRMEM